MDYNATLTIPTIPDTDDDTIDQILTDLTDYHPALAWPRTGETSVIITLPAVTLRQAIATSLALAASAHLDVRAITVEETRRFDLLADQTEVPPLVGVTEAAQILGVTAQAVRQRIKTGSLRGIRVGDAWALVRADLH